MDAILAGKAPAVIKDRARAAKFDERLAVLGLILDAVRTELRNVMETEGVVLELLAALRELKPSMTSSKGGRPAEVLKACTAKREKALFAGKAAGSLSGERQRQLQKVMLILEDMGRAIADEEDGAAAFKTVKELYGAQVGGIKKAAQTAGKQLTNVFAFCEEAFADGQEMLILVTELTISQHAAKFISRYGCEAYFKHNKELLFYERQKEIISEMENLELE